MSVSIAALNKSDIAGEIASAASSPGRGVLGSAHLMRRGRRDQEVPLYVGLRRQTVINLGVVVNERWILALLWSKHAFIPVRLRDCERG